MGIGCGLELARFLAVIFLTLATAVGVAVLMDPQFSLWEEDLPDLRRIGARPCEWWEDRS